MVCGQRTICLSFNKNRNLTHKRDRLSVVLALLMRFFCKACACYKPSVYVFADQMRLELDTVYRIKIYVYVQRCKSKNDKVIDRIFH